MAQTLSGTALQFKPAEHFFCFLTKPAPVLHAVSRPTWFSIQNLMQFFTAQVFFVFINPAVFILLLMIHKFSTVITLALLTVSLLANWYFYHQLNQTRNDLARLQTDKQTVAGDYDLLKRDLDLAIANLKALKHPQNRTILLNMLPGFTAGKATVFWNSSTGAVYIDATQLPAPPPDKQYQLWTETGGKYESLGVFNRQPDKEILYRLINTKKPDAFALSIELPQGSPTAPTQLCARGNVAF